MQHHAGSWYIPWNMGVPLQKMLTVPFNPSGQMTGAPGYPHHQPQIATAAIQHQQQPPSQQQGPSSPNPQQTYQQQLTALQHHAALQHQPMHPAAAAMFTPLTLRSFVTHPGLHNLSQQQLTNVQAGGGNGSTNVNGTHHTPTHQHSTNSQQNVPQTLSPNITNHHHSHAAAMLQHPQSHPHHSHAQQTPGQQLTTLTINGLNVTGLQSATAAALRHHAQHNNVLQAGSLMTIPSMKKVSKVYFVICSIKQDTCSYNKKVNQVKAKLPLHI